MHTANRSYFHRGWVTILAAACLVLPGAAAPPTSPSAAAAAELNKRRAAIEEAEELLTKGDQAYQAGRYADAVTAFSGAREMIPDSPLTATLRAEATERFAQASIEQAHALSRKGDIAAAKTSVDAVLKPGLAPNHPAANALRNQLDDPIRTNPTLTKEYTADVDAVRRLLYSAEGSYNAGKYDAAVKHYNAVLRLDPTNSAARRGLEHVAATKSAYQKSASDHTRAAMLADVDAGWETSVPPPITDVAAMDPNVPAPATGIVPVSNKLDRIILPNIILEDASLQDVIDLLRLRSAELDELEIDPARRGINFVVNIGDESSEIGNSIRAIRLNLRLTNVPIAQVLRYVNDQTRTSFTTDDFTVTIHPRGLGTKELVTRVYRVPPDFLSSLSSSNAPAAADPFSNKPAKGLLEQRRGALEVLREQGVQFPDGASASLNPSNNTLLVVNTPANQDVISQIVDITAKTEPVMVCVRVTMIKVQHNRLKELGFDWLLSPTGFGSTGWIPGTKTLNLSGGTQGNGGNLDDITLPNGQMERNPVTAGNRSGDEGALTDSIDARINANNLGATSVRTLRAPGVFEVSKVMSNSSVQVLMRGLDQKKGVDVMTAASTVTRSGQASTVQMVREMIYPTEYEPPELPNSVGIVSNGGGFPVSPAHPSAFDKRDVGIVLEVTPTADEAKRTVDVTINPSVVDFDGFVNYGSPINSVMPSDTLGSISAEVTPNRILMPVFSVNRLATNLTVADGSTIVIGGLLQDRARKIDDKTPLLGNLPLVGRLFQSKIDNSISKAIVFLVNVQLVDPTGQPYNKR
jgi:general secretion pathway protein D